MMRSSLALGMMFALGAPAFSQSQPLFPETFCQTLPPLSPELQAWVVSQAPELSGGDMRAVVYDSAKGLLGNAADLKASALELFTQDSVRGDCVFYISQETLAQIDTEFNLYLLTPFSANDDQGRAFRMQALVFGRGRLLMAYDRDRIHYKDPATGDGFVFAGMIREESPFVGTLNIRGISGPFGLPICALRMLSSTVVEVTAGIFKVQKPLLAIARRQQTPQVPATILVDASTRASDRLMRALPTAEQVLRWLNTR